MSKYTYNENELFYVDFKLDRDRKCNHALLDLTATDEQQQTINQTILNSVGIKLPVVEQTEKITAVFIKNDILRFIVKTDEQGNRTVVIYESIKPNDYADSLRTMFKGVNVVIDATAGKRNSNINKQPFYTVGQVASMFGNKPNKQ